MNFESKVVELYRSGKSGVKISSELDVPVHKVYYALQKAGVDRRSNRDNSRRYRVNHNYFSIIDTPEKAYWLGFFFADGYVTSRGNQKMCGVSLNVKDRQHLLQLASDLDSNYPVHDYSGETSYGYVEYARLLVTSPTMYSDLISYGCTELKSLTLAAPNSLPEEFVPDFIRGYFDGDGSFAMSKASAAGYRLKISGTKEFLSWVSKYLGGSIYTDSRSGHHVLECRATVERIDFLYYDTNIRCLPRKYARGMDAKRRILERSGQSKQV